MRYGRVLLPLTALVVMGACSTSGDPGENEGKVLQQVNPPGNNGTVKIQEAGSTTEMPDNDPHVGCVFTIEFRGYDQGDLTATWTLDGQPPSGTATIASGSVFIGGDPAGGANDLDGTVTVNLANYDLSVLKAQANQGYHLKLTVHAPGSQGADTKFKVFWVQGCTSDAGPPPPPPGDAGPPPPPSDAGPPPPPPPPPSDAGTPPSTSDAGPPPSPQMW